MIGKLKKEGGAEEYEGEFLMGKFNGRGKLVNYEGTYEGDFSQGRKHGFGFQLYSNGSEYLGNWRFGKYDGKGKYFDASKGTTEEGYWKNGKFMSSTVKITSSIIN